MWEHSEITQKTYENLVSFYQRIIDAKPPNLRPIDDITLSLLKEQIAGFDSYCKQNLQDTNESLVYNFYIFQIHKSLSEKDIIHDFILENFDYYPDMATYYQELKLPSEHEATTFIHKAIDNLIRHPRVKVYRLYKKNKIFLEFNYPQNILLQSFMKRFMYSYAFKCIFLEYDALYQSMDYFVPYYTEHIKSYAHYCE
jgi:hypothetical protein